MHDVHVLDAYQRAAFPDAVQHAQDHNPTSISINIQAYEAVVRPRNSIDPGVGPELPRGIRFLRHVIYPDECHQRFDL